MYIMVSRSWLPWGRPSVEITIEESNDVIHLEGARCTVKRSLYCRVPKSLEKLFKNNPK